MSVKITVLYPKNEGATFDMDYYLATHMPLVGEKWGPYGLKGWEVVQFRPGPDGSEPAYSVQASLIWDSPDDVKTAFASEETKTVLGDVPNFSNRDPILMGGPVMKAHTL